MPSAIFVIHYYRYYVPRVDRPKPDWKKKQTAKMPSVDFGLYYYVVKGIGFCELYCYWTIPTRNDS